MIRGYYDEFWIDLNTWEET